MAAFVPVSAQVLAQMGHEHMLTLEKKALIYSQYKDTMQTAKEQEKTITAQMAHSRTTVLSVLGHDNLPSLISLASVKKRPPLGTNVILELFEQYTREKLLEEFKDVVPLVASKKFLLAELLEAEKISRVEDLAPEQRTAFLQRVSVLHEQFSQHIRTSIPQLIQRFVYDQIISKMNIEVETLSGERKTQLATEVQQMHERMISHISTAVLAYNINAEAQDLRTKVQQYITDYREDNTETLECIKVKKPLTKKK